MSAIANRYARALVDVAFKRGQHEAVERELDQFGRLLLDNRELSVFYGNPAISTARKKAVTSQLLDRLGFSRIASNFVLVLVERNRVDHFDAIVTTFRQGVRDRLGIVEIGVTTSTEIGDGIRDQLRRALAELTARQVRLDFRTDPDILGGVIARVGDTIYDGSLRQQLQLMKDRLSSQD